MLHSNGKIARFTPGLEILECRDLLAQVPVITEFMAANRTGLADEDNQFSDWIEVHNPSENAIDLSGWHLTDDNSDRTKWSFPNRSLAPNEYLVIFASGKDRRNPSRELHTNFRLSRGGEFLSLVSPDESINLGFSPAYPLQQADISYGISSEGERRFFPVPSPGARNESGVVGFTNEVLFSARHGYFKEAFQIELSTRDHNETIRYTLDGSPPSAEQGFVFVEPIQIETTTTVRAAAFREGYLPQKVITQSYIFVEDTITQSNDVAFAHDFPSHWGGQEAHYEMSQRLIGQDGTDEFRGVYANTVRNDLIAAPTISITIDQEEMFGDQGLMSNPSERGLEWERQASIEFIDPQGHEDGFQVEAGVRIHGGFSRGIRNPKKSFRIIFRHDYGASKLEYPLFGDDQPSSFDSIVLRSSGGELGSLGLHYIRDAYVRALHAATGNDALPSRFVHFYINGLYWGMYEAVERLNAQHMANSFGGDKDEWDVIKPGENPGRLIADSGTMQAWNQTVDLAREVSRARTRDEELAAYYRLQGRGVDGTINPEWEQYIDLDSYIDYLIVTLFTKSGGWPNENFVMARRRGTDSTGFKFLMWDNEFSLDAGWQRSIDKLGSTGPAVILDSLKASQDFRLRFSDRMQFHLDPGGALYVNPDDSKWDVRRPENNRPAAIYAGLVDQVRSPLVPESARWNFGFTVNGSFQRTVDRNLSDFQDRSSTFAGELAEAGYYRPAPRILRTDTETELSSSSGQIFYTRNGSDPRRVDGSISDDAILYIDPIENPTGIALRARSYDGESWSAITSRLPLNNIVTDVDANGSSDVGDINAMCMAIRTGNGGIDFDDDQTVSLADFRILIRDGFDTVLGDANLDGRFDSTDLVAIFVAGAFEVVNDEARSWSQGDWNCDGNFTTLDLVMALQSGGYKSDSL